MTKPILYQGERAATGCIVRRTSGAVTMLLPPRLDLASHSPTGFEWGYGGSGPAQLALALCVDAVGEARAMRIYQAVKWTLIARLPHKGWQLTRADLLESIRFAETGETDEK